MNKADKKELTKKLLEFFELSGMKWPEFAEGLPIKGNSLRMAFNRGEVRTTYLNKLKDKFLANEQLRTNNTHNNSSVPLYDNENMNKPKTFVKLGDILEGSDAAIRIYGDSMLPNFPSGCVVGLKEVKDKIIEWGKVYAIHTEGGTYVKRIYGNSEIITCHSDNVSVYSTGPRKGKYHYEPFDIEWSKIKKVSKIIGTIYRTDNKVLI